MTDIDRAIEILENGKWWDYLCDNIPDEYHEDIYQATGLAIEALKEKRERRWIPVSERLPDIAGEYLVLYHPCYWDNVRAETCVGIDTFRGKVAWAKKKHQRVTAWQPLPKPWEGGCK